MRLRKIPSARGRLDLQPELVVLDPACHKGRWKGRFGNGNPIFLEIGAGKGQFICGVSEQLPGVNFLGMEKYDSVLLRAMQRLTATPRQNTLLVLGEAEKLLDYFDENEIQRLYLNFSDPWHKKRYTKRRLTHTIFLEKYHHILLPNSEIHIKTDNRKFFEFSLQQMNEYGMVFDCINLDLHAEEPESNIRTEYEVSRSAGGATIYRLVCRFR